MTLATSRRTLVLAIALAAAGVQAATPLDGTITYQAQLKSGGVPANGAFDFQFRLYDAPGGGIQIGPTVLVDDRLLADGLLTANLNFAPAAPFNGDQRYLEIDIRAGASIGAYTTLSPRQALTEAAYATQAVTAEVALATAPNSVDGTALIDGTVKAADIDASQVQRRVAGVCAASAAIRAVNGDGTVSCEPVGAGAGGDITSVGAGMGLAGGGANGDVSLAIANSGVVSAMIAPGAVGQAQVNATEVQRRVSAGCAPGSAIRGVNMDGTVACDSGSGAGGSGWGLAGNAGTNPGANFIGTTDAVPLVMRAGDQRALQLSREQRIAGQTTYRSVNVLAGAPINSISAGVIGATVGGGGLDVTGLGANARPNVVTDENGTVAGGNGNRAGDDDGNPIDAAGAFVGGGQVNTASAAFAVVAGGLENIASGPGATVGGGFSSEASGAHAVSAGGYNNTAAGDRSSIAGGENNSAVGQYASVPGGFSNSAGGTTSFAGGYNAAVRSASEVGDDDGDEGTFVWSDTSISDEFGSTGPNQFLVRADGGMALNAPPLDENVELTITANRASNYANVFLKQRGNTAGVLLSAGAATASNNDAVFVIDQYSPFGQFTSQTRRLTMGAGGGFGLNTSVSDKPLRVGSDSTNGNGAYLSVGGTWTNASSRSFKQDIRTLDVQALLDKLLELQIASWRYRGPEQGRHVGPFAEDFAAAFGLGDDPQHIATVDADGVALAAIQALAQRLEAQAASQAALRAEADGLQRANAELERRLSRIEAVSRRDEGSVGARRSAEHVR